MTRRLRPDGLGDERGIASVMVGVSVMAIFGSAAIAVDLGHLWSSRRHVITATDASALAAATEYAIGGNGCSMASGYVNDNDAAAGMTECGATPTSPVSGYVTVGAETPVDYAFAGVLGFSDRTVGSATTASWGLPSGVNGLRPFGLCWDEPGFQAWLAGPRGQSPAVQVMYTNDGTACGGAPGNWGIVDLDNAGNVSNSDTKQWVRYGYPGVVRPGNMGGTPGAISNSVAPDLAAVQFKRFPIPIFDRLTENGSNAQFHVVGFVGVQLLSWQTNGSEDSRYLELKFVEMVGSGECCENSGVDFGLRVVHICGVDETVDTSNCM